MNLDSLGFISQLGSVWHVAFVIVLLVAGLYTVISRTHLVKKILGLNVFQVAVILFYVSIGNVAGGTAPILTGDPDTIYSNPLPHVLMLTAIVVGVATTAVGLSLIVRIHESFGTVDEDELDEILASEESEG